MEATLVNNHVENVLASDSFASAGQLLPLLIGMFSAGRLGWIIYNDHRKGDAHEAMHNLDSQLGDKKQWKDMFSLKLRKEKPGHLLFDLLTHWMPWLNCFPSWRRMRTPTFSLQDAESASTTPGVEKSEYQAVTKS